MAKQKRDMRFEELSFRATIMEHPGDRTARNAYADWLFESGECRTMFAAKLKATRLSREASQEWIRARVQDWLNGKDGPEVDLVRLAIFVGRSWWIGRRRPIQVMIEPAVPQEIVSYAPVRRDTPLGFGKLGRVVELEGGVRAVEHVTQWVGYRWVLNYCRERNITISTLRGEGEPERFDV